MILCLFLRLVSFYLSLKVIYFLCLYRKLDICWQVRAAVSALGYFRGLPKLPADFQVPATREEDMFDFLHYVFGFQVSWSSCNAINVGDFN